MGIKQSRQRVHLFFVFAYVMITPVLMYGCSHSRPAFKEANDFLSQGNYKASLSKYEQIIAQYPAEGARVLYEMGVIYAFPKNQQKDYQKSLEYFQKLVKDYPENEYRQDSEVMISLINEVIRKTSLINEVTSVTQQKQIETLQEEVKSKGDLIVTQQNQIETLEQEVISKGNKIITKQNQIETLEQQILSKGDKIFTQQKQIEALEQEVISKGNRISSQQKQIETLDQHVKELEKKIGQIKEVDMNLKEKKKSFPEKQ
ncbi:MAG TPA: tetratricopeptide repeat protein [Syntrophales bacterium]|nr:tetratricopeptide repeat protein [Syntrophales bacterium]